MVDLDSRSTEEEDTGRAGPAAARDSPNQEHGKIEAVRMLSVCEPTRPCVVMKRIPRTICVSLVTGLSLMLGSISAYAIQNETHEEKTANLKKQAVGGFSKSGRSTRMSPTVSPPASLRRFPLTNRLRSGWSRLMRRHLLRRTWSLAPRPVLRIVTSFYWPRECSMNILT